MNKTRRSSLVRRSAAPVVAVLAALAVPGLAACGSSSKQSATPVTVFSLSADPARDIPVTVPGHRVVLTAAQLRTALDSLFSNHVKLIAALMHEVGAGSSDTGAAVHALAANTQSLTDAIAVIYGIPAARAFAQLWEQHTQFFIDYAQATRGHDGAAKKEALSRLRDYQNDFGNFVSTATANGVGLLAVTNLLRGHVQDLTRYIDADVGGHTADAAQILVQAVAHIRVIAHAMGDAIIAQHLNTVTP